MIFNSFEFLMFFIIISVVYFVVPQKFKWIFLLVSSYIFYMSWNVIYIILLLFITIVNYICSILIVKSGNYIEGKKYLNISLLISFATLFIFKYFNFTIESIYNILGNENFKEFDIILPMGISFFTFQAVSYTIDVYRGKIKPVRNFFKFSLYIAFFPQLVAGPIERFETLYPQLFKNNKFKIDNLIIGGKYLLSGFFKKIVLADRLSMVVNNVYNEPSYYGGISLIIATIFFSFQIYCDFAGYSEIAKGVAKILDIDIMSNFKSPYLAKSIKGFWARWHISLSSWFRDYVYIPLGGNRKGEIKVCINLFITFLLSGLWHGANFTFIVWGVIHGGYQIIERILFNTLKKYDFKIPSFFGIVQIVFTFILVSLAWIFFRANSISDGVYVICNLFNDIENLFSRQYMYTVINGLGVNVFEVLICLIGIMFLWFTEFLKEYIKIKNGLLEKSIEYVYYFILASFIITLGVYTSGAEFIYFQF